MDFKQFLAAKQALALVEHMQTLSEADALELFNTLDEETIEFIEAVLSENLPSNFDEKGNRIPVYGKTGMKNVQIRHKNPYRGAPFHNIEDRDPIEEPSREAAIQRLSSDPEDKKELDAGNFTIKPFAHSNRRSNTRGVKNLPSLRTRKIRAAKAGRDPL